MFWTRGLEALARAFDLRSSAKWLFLSGLVGVVAGLGAIVFQLLSHAVIHLALIAVAGYVPGETAGEHSLWSPAEATLSPFWLIVVLVAGGLASGWLVQTFAPEAEGHGTDAAIEAFHRKGGRIRRRIPIIKTLASAVTIGTGGSGGREGPIAQIGAGFGSALATALKLSVRDRRILLAAGMGAGVGAIFRAPLAGALFAGEILYREADLETDVVVPSAISSIVAYSVFALSLPADKRFTPLFGSQLNYEMSSFVELLPMAALAGLLVLVGIAYIKTFYGLHNLFKRLPMPAMLKPALGAGLTGLVALGFFWSMDFDRRSLSVLATGYGVLQDCLNPTDASGAPAVPAVLLFSIAIMKILTTSLTIGSGGSGGVFGPSMVIGGCVGAAFGQTLHHVFPELAAVPQVYAIVGMAGFFAGCAHAPLSTIIMVSEMTGSYKLLLPSMWVCMLCFLFGRRWSLYSKQVASRLESPAHRGDFNFDVLEGLHVSDVPLKERLTIRESMTLEEINRLIPETRQHYFPVVDTDGGLAGVFSIDDIRSYLYDETLWQLAVARDVMSTKILTVTLDDDLDTAMRRFTQLNLDEIPVVEAGNPRRLKGMLRRKDVIGVYNRRILEQRLAVQAEEAI